MTWGVGAVVTSAQLNTYLPQSSTAWTPAWTNLTVGNGTQTAQWSRAGCIVTVELRLVFGTTTSISGTVSLTGLPANPSYAGSGTLTMADISAATRFVGGVEVVAASSSIILVNSPSGFLNATTPFTWANTDTLTFSVSYLIG